MLVDLPTDGDALVELTLQVAKVLLATEQAVTPSGFKLGLRLLTVLLARPLNFCEAGGEMTLRSPLLCGVTLLRRVPSRALPFLSPSQRGVTFVLPDIVLMGEISLLQFQFAM